MMKTYTQLSLFPAVTSEPPPLPLWHTAPKAWGELNHLLHTDKLKFVLAVELRLKEYWRQAPERDKTPKYAFLAVFSALPPKSLDAAYKVLKSGVHPKALGDFDKALLVARLR